LAGALQGKVAGSAGNRLYFR